MDESSITLIMHIIGNNLPHARFYHEGNSDSTPDDIRTMQLEVADRFERIVREKKIDGVDDLFDALQRSDWSDKSSYQGFLDIYQRAVGQSEDERRKLRDEIFKNS